MPVTTKRGSEAASTPVTTPTPNAAAPRTAGLHLDLPKSAVASHPRRTRHLGQRADLGHLVEEEEEERAVPGPPGCLRLIAAAKQAAAWTWCRRVREAIRSERKSFGTAPLAHASHLIRQRGTGTPLGDLSLAS
jgi:hypothetical protein